jgi:hypothetical protein
MKYSFLALALLLPTASVSAWSSSRRELLQQVSSAAAVVLAAPLPSSAGLLDDFGTDPDKIVQKEAPPPVVAVTRKGESGIDPTLKGCKYRNWSVVAITVRAFSRRVLTFLQPTIIRLPRNDTSPESLE